MKDMISRFISRNYTLSIIIGVIASIFGIGLAYLTKDAEPWGTIGGIVCALGFILAMHAIFSKNR